MKLNTETERILNFMLVLNRAEEYKRILEGHRKYAQRRYEIFYQKLSKKYKTEIEQMQEPAFEFDYPISNQ